MAGVMTGVRTGIAATAVAAAMPSMAEVLELAIGMRAVGMEDRIFALGGRADFLPRGNVNAQGVVQTYDLFTLQEKNRAWSLFVTWEQGDKHHLRVTWTIPAP